MTDAAPQRNAGEEPSPSALFRIGRISGLDTLRFLLACWVVLGHAGFIPLRSLLIAIHAPRIAWAISTNLFNGAAAVMAFFAISGFCIHLNFKTAAQAPLLSYYIRREVRILPPVIVMLIVGGLTGNYAFLTVTWSLICEECYYVLYPLFRKRLVAHGFKKLLIATVVCWVVLLFAVKGNTLIWGKGPALTWLLCSSVWVLGAALAEDLSNGRTLNSRFKLECPTRSIWTWRLVLIVCSIGCNYAKLAGINIQFLLIPFGWMACLWIEQEIYLFRIRPAKAIFESMGKASYSLYLTHPCIIASAWTIKKGIPSFNTRVYEHYLPLVIWVPTMVGVFALTAVMYYCVELPSHRFARYLGKKV